MSDISKDLHQALSVTLSPEVRVFHESEGYYRHWDRIQPTVPQSKVYVPFSPLSHLVADLHCLVEHI